MASWSSNLPPICWVVLTRGSINQSELWAKLRIQAVGMSGFRRSLSR